MVNEMKLPRFEFFTESGARAVHDGFVVTFFLPHNHVQISPSVQAAIDLYLQLPGLSETLGTIDDEGYPVLLDTNHLKTIIVQKLDPSFIEATLQIVDTKDGASQFSVRYFGFDSETRNKLGWPNAVSGINFTFPADFQGESGLISMFNFANELAVLLPFSFGYISPAFLFHEGVAEPAAFEMIIRLSKRYRCFDIPALLPDCFEMGEGPKGAFWGNYLNKGLVARLGGEAAIRRYFHSKGIRIRIDDSGSMSLYLSPIPVAGDKNRREDIRVYKRVFSLFSKLMLPRNVSYLEFDDEEMFDWIHRF